MAKRLPPETRTPERLRADRLDTADREERKATHRDPRALDVSRPLWLPPEECAAEDAAPVAFTAAANEAAAVARYGALCQDPAEASAVGARNARTSHARRRVDRSVPLVVEWRLQQPNARIACGRGEIAPANRRNRAHSQGWHRRQCSQPR